MTIQWQSQVALITGASGGIGSAMASVLDNKGAHLILVGRNEDKLEQLQCSLSCPHTLVVADITTALGREKVLHTCQRLPLSMVINNAGITHVGEYNQAPVEAVININILSPMLLTQQLLPLLDMCPHAHVVNIGSTFGSIGFAANSTYCATKFALKGWTEAMLREYHDSHVQFHYLAPRATETALNDPRTVALNHTLGNRVDRPEAVAQQLITLLERNKKRVQMGWPEFFFDKLNGLFPSLVDRALAKKLAVIKQHTFKKSHGDTQPTTMKKATSFSNKTV